MIKVIDNVIGDKYSSYVFEECAKLKWTFVPEISVGNNPNGRNTSGFSYNFFLNKHFNNNEQKTIRDSKYDLICPIFLEAFDKLQMNLDLSDIFRCRARLTLPQYGLSEKDRVDVPHNDYKSPHWVMIYYVNNVDGDTLMFDGNKIIDRIAPRRGQVVLFDGSILHASTTPALNPRIIINSNIFKRD